MKTTGWQSSLRFVLATIVLPAVVSSTAFALPGDEQNGNEQNRPASNSANERQANASLLPATNTAERQDTALAKALRELTDQELLAIARGGELPAAMTERFGASPTGMQEALLAELARRWDRPSHDMSVATPITSRETENGANTETESSKQVADQPTEPATITLERAEIEAISGEPANVLAMELTFVEGQGPVIYPDQPLLVESTDGRAHYVTFDVSYQEQDASVPWVAKQIRVFSLLRGAEPVELTISGIKGFVLDQQQVTLVESPERHRELLDRWWKHFATVPKDLDPETQFLKESLLDILARRFNLPGPWPKYSTRTKDESFNLERQFERAVGMLFGIESVKLAMQEDETLTRSSRQETANRPIPDRPRLASVTIPNFSESTWIEPIAMHVPAECFYLRTGNLANYRYFRQFLLGWGGNLDDIVTTPSLSHQTRSRIEFQLGLDPEQVSAAEFDKLVSDMALIGCDPLFADGAAVGLLFQARDARGLLDLIKAQRNAASRRVPDASEQRIDFGRHAASLLATPDNRIRSFYAIDGDYHLVTNSRYLLQRFFDAGDGDRSLAALREFRYARSKANDRRQTIAFLYLSDPFFQNLVSPHFRIELTRRRQAAEELQQVQLAQLVARAERLDADTIDEFIEARLLPTDFGIRPDGSHPVLSDGRAIDSLRGAPGTFLPVLDVPLQRATDSEIYSYHSFLQKYNSQWHRVDPVTVVFSNEGAAGSGLQRVGLDILVTPYAKQAYSLLERHLATAGTLRVAPVDGDLLSVDTAIRIQPGGLPHLLYLGLRDADVSFTFTDGQVELVDQRAGTSFAKSRSYVAITPPNTGLLRLLASVLDPNRASASPPQLVLQPGGSRAPPPPLMMSAIGNALFYFGWAMGNMTQTMSDLAKHATQIETRDGWTVVSTHDEIRRGTPDLLREEQIATPTQVRMRMGSLSGSKVEPYIQAYTYLASRRVSGENARFLNDFANWLQLPPDEARDEAERLLGATFHCPLGGRLELQENGGRPQWVSSSWMESSLYTVSETPDDWRFPFLDWARGLDLRFDLDASTLRARVDLLIHQKNDSKNVDTLEGLQMAGVVGVTPDPNVQTVGFQTGPTVERTVSSAPAPIAPTPALTANSNAMRRVRAGSATIDSDATRDWVLGVRVRMGEEPIRVRHVYENSPAARAGIRTGDVIRSVDGRAPRDHQHLAELLDAARNKGVANVRVNRDGSDFALSVRFPSHEMYINR